MKPNSIAVRAAVFALAAGLFAGAGLAVAQDYGAGKRAFMARDFAQAYEIMQPLARGGDPRAQYAVGLMYADGRGVARDAAQAERWYRLAGAQGHAQAQYNLGFMLETGATGAPDPAAAAGWYRRAAASGLALAKNNLAILYVEGRGVERDSGEAARLFSAAADASNEALENRSRLENLYDRAEIVGQDVNLRAGPSLSAEVLAKLDDASRARLLEQRNGWSRLWFVREGRIGWVATRLTRDSELRQGTVEIGALLDASAAPLALEADTAPRSPAQPRPPAASTPSPGATQRRVATEELNVRDRPSASAPIVARLVRDDTVVVLESRKGWERVRFAGGDQTGWVAAFLLAAPTATIGRGG